MNAGCISENPQKSAGDVLPRCSTELKTAETRCGRNSQYDADTGRLDSQPEFFPRDDGLPVKPDKSWQGQRRR
jgi:hypothetical protein